MLICPSWQRSCLTVAKSGVVIWLRAAAHADATEALVNAAGPSGGAAAPVVPTDAAPPAGAAPADDDEPPPPEPFGAHTSIM